MTAWAPVRAVLDEGIETAVFPGGIVEVGSSQGPRWRHASGRTTYDADAPAVTDDTIYDLASLTKVLATTPVALHAAAVGRLDLTSRVSHWLTSWTGADRAAVTLVDLLEHDSGLPAWLPLFESCRDRASFERTIAATPLACAPGTSSLYSDLGFILLGFLLEDACGGPLDQLADEVWRAVGLDPSPGLWFVPPAVVHPRIAPTRGTDQVGADPRCLVDDANAAALGGIAGHAGMFGTAAAVGAFATAILRALREGSGPVLLRRIMDLALVRSIVPGSTRARGWDFMATTSSCGSRMSSAAFGHTGFTGTSLWIDPAAETYVVLLTNRVYPKPGSPEGIQRIRRAMHDAVLEALQG